MTQPLQTGPSPDPAGPTAQRVEQILDATIGQLEEMRARSGSGDIADRLRTVCDRLRSAQGEAPVVVVAARIPQQSAGSARRFPHGYGPGSHARKPPAGWGRLDGGWFGCPQHPRPRMGANEGVPPGLEQA